VQRDGPGVGRAEGVAQVGGAVGLEHIPRPGPVRSKNASSLRRYGSPIARTRKSSGMPTLQRLCADAGMLLGPHPVCEAT
ncbi:MAG TPA: hypothetical protein VF734_17325, partial [Pseudonocardiaceae bacterium]